MEQRALRDDMVDSLTHEAKGVLTDDRLARAMRQVPRHEFAPPESAYADTAHTRLGSRILAPSTAARLLEALAVTPGDSVLIVGAGVGYTAAVCAELTGAASVHALEISRQLVLEARDNLAAAGYPGVLVDCRDGAYGLEEYAPYDRILLEAAAVAPPRAVREQLSPTGRLVMPLGTAPQSLTVISATGDQTERGTVSFQPLLVDGEHPNTTERNRMRREEQERAERAKQRRAGWEHDWIDWDDY